MPDSKHIARIVLVCLFIGCSDDSVNPANKMNTGPAEIEDKTTQFKDSTMMGNQAGIAMDAQVPSPADRRKKTKNQAGRIASNNDFQPQQSQSDNFVNTMRVWQDDKSMFKTSAELLAVATSSRQVRLLKQNGVTITVPFDRLSNHDKNFVKQFAKAQLEKPNRLTPQLVEAFD